ncbi:MAG: HAD-IB family hydrolase [Gemmatimonadetes bacterium]|nr:HAD-IB family hydrolase [Gemmatimonadota bacterium]
MTTDFAPARSSAATFLDFDGTLAKTNLVQVYAYLARHAGTRVGVMRRYTSLLADIPGMLGLDAFSRPAFAERLFSHYAGLSRDRIETFAPRLHREVLAPRIFPAVGEFLKACRGRGPLVLVTGAPDFTVRYFAEEHGIEHVIANRLEFRGGIATGRVLPPMVFGSTKARLMREWARENGVDLERSAAYADSISDASMLDTVGRGGVINPGPKLARMARDFNWQILNF